MNPGAGADVFHSMSAFFTEAAPLSPETPLGELVAAASRLLCFLSERSLPPHTFVSAELVLALRRAGSKFAGVWGTAKPITPPSLPFASNPKNRLLS